MESLNVYFRWISRGKFVRMGEKSGIDAKVMERTIDRMSKMIVREAPRLARRCARQWPSSCYDRIVTGVLERAEQLKGTKE